MEEAVRRMDEQLQRHAIYMGRATIAKMLAAVTPPIQRAERERCLAAGGKAWPKAHTYASENAELYRAQDEAARRVLAAIRALG